MSNNIDIIKLRVVGIIKGQLVNLVSIDCPCSVEEFYGVLQTEKVYRS